MIATSVNRIIYLGNGTTTAWSYPFKIINKTDIKLMLVDAEGNKTNITSDYYVDATAAKVYYPGYAPGAEEPEADQPAKVQSGEKLVIYRDVPINQLDSMPTQWPFDVNESMHDKSCIIDQQLKDAIDRSLKFDMDISGSFDATLPIKAGYGWRVSDDGQKIVTLSNPEGVYNDTVDVYNAAVADTTAIKNNTEALKNATEGYKNAAAASASAAQGYMQTASTKADTAISYANEAGRAAQIASKAAEKVEVYDDTKTYHLGDVVCSASGNTYRCIATSTGESPSTSNKWVMTATVLYQTFETDSLGDLMVRYPPSVSSNWEIDDHGDIMPYSSSVLVNAEEVEF